MLYSFVCIIGKNYHRYDWVQINRKVEMPICLHYSVSCSYFIKFCNICDFDKEAQQVNKFVMGFSMQVAYYIEATEADNHAVREAACACIAELALKIARGSVRAHVPDLLHALTVCFSDDSWPVRDGKNIKGSVKIRRGSYVTFYFQ